jgi:hypothetical protein
MQPMIEPELSSLPGAIGFPLQQTRGRRGALLGKERLAQFGRIIRIQRGSTGSEPVNEDPSVVSALSFGSRTN